jgi:hypothetical protein
MFALRYMGDGEFRALHPKLTDRELVVGEVLRWEVAAERSAESHRHFFAVINDAWQNLPDRFVMDFPTPEHLRKFCLIKAGYCTMSKVVCATKMEARRSMVVVRKLDSYAVCEIAGNVLTIYQAESQNMKAMGKKKFQESKDAVFRILSEMLGADVAEAGRAA